MDDAVTLTLRIPKRLKEWLSSRSQRHLRSQNSEAIVLLRESMERDAEDRRAGGAE